MNLLYCAAAGIPGRSDVQCQHRWQKVVNPEIIKGYWTDEVLITYILQCLWQWSTSEAFY